jgi:hypothetical protein
MLRPEDVETILTTHDLSVYLKAMVQKDDRDLKIDIDYESGELFTIVRDSQTGSL